MTWFFSSRFERHYLRRMVHERRLMELRGVEARRSRTLRLDDVYVDLRLSANDFGDGADALSGHTIWEQLAALVEMPGLGLVVLGAPGSGKSTLLSHVALTLAARGTHPALSRSFLPVVLAMREYADVVTGDAPPSLGQLLEARHRGASPSPSSGWFEAQLERGRCLVLCDGLDEIASLAQRRRASAWLDRQIETYPSTVFVVSSCPHAYEEAKLEHVRVCNILRFGAQDMRASLDRVLVGDLESREAGHVPLAAGMRLAQRLHSLHRIDYRREIDLGFVSAAEYQLFVDDARGGAVSCLPDHWLGPHFPPGEGGLPVRGVRAEDAGRFVAWLSQRQGGPWTFRLPTPDEARRFVADAAGPMAAWCQSGDFRTLVGLTPGEERRFKSELGRFSRLPAPSSVSFEIARIFDPRVARGVDIDLAIVLCLSLGEALGAVVPKAAVIQALERVGARIGQRALLRALAYARARARDLGLDEDQTLAVALRPVFDWLHAGTSARQSGEGELLSEGELEEERSEELALIEHSWLSARGRSWRSPTGRVAAALSLMQSLVYWCLAIRERKRGALRAWEGIRIVRERPLD